MARVKRYLDSRASDSQERWLVSYADFITLLFAFFVVMYAISSVNESKYRVVGSAIGTAFGSAAAGAGPAAQGRVRAARESDARRARSERAMEAARKAFAGTGDVQARLSGRGVVIDIGSRTLFGSGQAALQDGALGPLAMLADALRALRQPIEVEGHTDDAPIRTARFPSNWELSAARASAVVRFLQDSGIEPGRLAATGYGEYRPAAPNSSEEGRARNRRVSIVIVDPEAGAAAAPARPFEPIEFPVR